MKQAAPAGSRAGLALALLCLAAPARAGGSCTISGLACPNEHTDTDIDYTHIDSSNNKWIWSGTTSDGRSWYENDGVSNGVKYLYYSTRAGGWFLTATAPDFRCGSLGRRQRSGQIFRPVRWRQRFPRRGLPRRTDLLWPRYRRSRR